MVVAVDRINAALETIEHPVAEVEDPADGMLIRVVTALRTLGFVLPEFRFGAVEPAEQPLGVDQSIDQEAALGVAVEKRSWYAATNSVLICFFCLIGVVGCLISNQENLACRNTLPDLEEPRSVILTEYLIERTCLIDGRRITELIIGANSHYWKDVWDVATIRKVVDYVTIHNSRPPSIPFMNLFREEDYLKRRVNAQSILGKFATKAPLFTIDNVGVAIFPKREKEFEIHRQSCWGMPDIPKGYLKLKCGLGCSGPSGACLETERWDDSSLSARLNVGYFYPRTQAYYGAISGTFGCIRRSLSGLCLSIQFPYCIVDISVYQRCSCGKVLRRLGTFRGRTCLFLCGVCDSLRVNSTSVYLPPSKGTEPGHYHCENCYPDSSGSRFSSCPIRWGLVGALFFVLGAVLMHIAFYVQDEPAPELRWRIVGLLLCLTSAACILWSVYVIAHVISSLTDTYNVSQKLLTWPEFSYYNKTMANILPTEKQVAIVSSLCEGSSICSIERITGVHRDTIMRLGVRIGQGCTALMSEKMRDLPCTRLEMDEIWGFIGKKERRVQPHDDRRLGDVWTFCAIDADTKLVPAFKVGKRDSATANAFVADISNRMRNRVQISTDGLRAYVDAIDQAFGGYVDIPPVVSPQTAVQAAIVQEFRNRAKAN